MTEHERDRVLATGVADRVQLAENGWRPARDCMTRRSARPASLLIATMFSEDCIPTLCWIAPEIRPRGTASARPSCRSGRSARRTGTSPRPPPRGSPRRRCCRERLGQLLGQLEVLGLAEPPAAGHEDVRTLDVHVGAALLAALDHLRLVRPRRVLDLDVDDFRRAAVVLLDLERVDPADDDPEVALVAGYRDLRVLEDRPLRHELAVLGLDRRDLHRHAGVLARGQAGADLEPEQAAAEQA